MYGSMNCCGDLYAVSNIGIVSEDCIRTAQAWGKLFNFEIPAPVDAYEFIRGLHAGGALYAHPPLKGDRVTMPGEYPPEGSIAQVNILQKKYAFEVKHGKLEGEGFVRTFYKEHGNGIVYLGYWEKGNRHHMVHHLIKDYGCRRTEYMKYGERDPHRGDWTALDTEQLLGVNLVIKDEGWSEYKTFPQMDDFDEITMIVPDVKETVKNWGNIFGVPTPRKRHMQTDITLRGKSERTTLYAARITDGAYVINFIQADSHPEFRNFLHNRVYGGAHQVVMGRTAEEIQEIEQILFEEYGVGILMEYDLFGKHYKVYDSMELLGIHLAVYQIEDEEEMVL